MSTILTRIFCNVDDFCKVYEVYCKSHLITADIQGKQLLPKTCMSLSEIMTIVIFFHLSNQRTFKWYYLNFVCKQLKEYFPKLLSYNRFVEVMRSALPPLLLYALQFRVGKCTGLSFIDSTTLDVCHNRRIHSHKVFLGLAQRGKSSTGWFYGFKLHLVINEKGELLSFCLTPGNADDRNIDVVDRLSKELFGKLFADKGYISGKLFEHLYARSITLITKVKKNMKNKLMDISDKILLILISIKRIDKIPP